MIRRFEDELSLMYAFDSMTDVINFSDPNLGKKVLQRGGESFIGQRFDSWDSVVSKSHSDWDDGKEILKANLEALSKVKIPELKSSKRVLEWRSDGGDEYFPERALDGLPAWAVYTREQTTGENTVTIFVDTSAAASVHHSDILWRGAAAVALLKLLEEKGYRCELWCVNGSYLFSTPSFFGGSNDGKRVMTACCLKRTSDPLDAATLINTVSGWFYRSATFTVLETIGEKERKRINPSYGAVATPTQTDLNKLSMDQNRIYSTGVYAFNAAVSMITAEVQKLADSQTK